MTKVAKHMQPKRAAKRPKAPKNGSRDQGGAKLAPKAPKNGPNDSFPMSSGTEVPFCIKEFLDAKGAEDGSSGQGGQYEQDQSSHNPDSGDQGGAENIGTEEAVADKAAFRLPARKAGVPVRGTGVAPHGDEGFRDRKVGLRGSRCKEI